ncbi:hypothetical protein [Nocardioides marmoriginsengisoli]|uniref:hypothetical protein n=1 Tax=Nocardioides marmoriginsengisoli TaxID=661483 RepID=UPI0011CD751D|nr:hypothetical protein [Nocardioides marmoriginsengisoli]
MDAKEWLARVTDHASINAIAGAAAVPQKTLDTQVRSATGLKPDMVVKIARAYKGAEPIAALVELGLITAEEARSNAGVEQVSVAEALAKASNSELLTEIGRRLDEELLHEDGDTSRLSSNKVNSRQRRRVEAALVDPSGKR